MDAVDRPLPRQASRKRPLLTYLALLSLPVIGILYRSGGLSEITDGSALTTAILNATSGVPAERAADDGVEKKRVEDTDDEKKPANDNHNSSAEAAVVVAYVISLIKCGDRISSERGLMEAALVLRHSAHQTSIRNPQSGSKYDYRMYAIVHSQAVDCSRPLRDAGYTLVTKDPPVKVSEIQDSWLRRSIHKEWCCGSDEFVKLYTYTAFSESIVVHVDLDYIFHRPMDDLFDAMLYSSDSAEGKAARERIPLEPTSSKWPDRVNAFMTRDWPAVYPGRQPGFQAGFLVTRPNATVFADLVAIIRKGHFVPGYQYENGWGGKGYGGFVGAMAMQGLLAYYYDQFRPNEWMELNQCRYNHMGMIVKNGEKGKCKNGRKSCEDCRTTQLADVYNIHYTQCRKPWACIHRGTKKQKMGPKLIPEFWVHVDHCMEMAKIWHSHRADMEEKLFRLTGEKSTRREGSVGTYYKEYFQGHCRGEGEENYIWLANTTSLVKRVPELYRR